MTTIRIDFETRSECDLLKAGAWKYSMDPTTDVLLYAYKVADGPVTSCVVAEDIADNFWQGCPYDFEGDEHLFEAHNAGFEFAIWNNIMAPRYNWPQLAPEDWYCSAAKAAAHGLPRDLDRAARAMGLPHEKDKKGHALMLKLCKPRPQWKKIGKGDKYFGTPEEFEKLKAYCERDVQVEYELSLALKPLSDTERKVYLMDQKINNRGVHCDRELVARSIELSSKESSRGNAEIKALSDGEIQTTGQTDKIRKFLSWRYFTVLPNLQAKTVDDAIDSDIAEGAKRVLRLRQKHSKSSVKKYLAMDARVGPDSRIWETIMYHGAHTGRWSGKGIQPHNYPRPKLSRVEIEALIPSILERDTSLLEFYRGSVSNVLSDALRSAITAAPGHYLIGADYSSIENRVLLWLADDQAALNKIRAGADLYVDMASVIYGVPLEKLLEQVKGGHPTAKGQRQVGKAVVLGAGYQMGPKRFKKELQEKQGIIISSAAAGLIISEYRTLYHKVKELWYNVNHAALSALTSPTWTSEGRPLLMFKEGPFLFIELPSGRLLAYKDPEIRVNKFRRNALSHMHIDPKTHQWVRKTTYGGALVENIVQAIARDIMAEAMLRCEDRSYPIVLTVHDEVVAEVTKDFGSILEFEKLLCEPPKWAPGCPIAAEGWRGERYRK